MSQNIQSKLSNLPVLPQAEQQFIGLVPTNTSNLSPKALAGQAAIAAPTLSAAFAIGAQQSLSKQLDIAIGASSVTTNMQVVTASNIVQQEIDWTENNETIVTEAASIQGQIFSNSNLNVANLSNKSVRDLSQSTTAQAAFILSATNTTTTNSINIILAAQSNAEQISQEYTAFVALSTL